MPRASSAGVSVLVVAVVAVLASWIASASRAAAYPQFQLSTHASRCNSCHYSPAGGGLINGNGRIAAGDSISSGGDGGFLHGLWTPPKWLALGGDGRFAALVNNVNAAQGTEFALFPMQSDLYGRVEVGPFSLYASVGLSGNTGRSQSIGEHFTSSSSYISREHYLMWQPQPEGPYVRAGRFFAPYGLRIAEHPTYVRRFLGFNILEETYNISGGYLSDDWELHVTAFTPDFFRPMGMRGSGGAAYVERRFGGRLAAAAEARVSIADANTRAQGGLVGKVLLPGTSILLLGQVDLVHETFDAVDAPRWQLAAYLGVSWLRTRGFMTQLVLERWDEDLSISGVARTAIDASFQWFPIAHVEVSLFGRLGFIGTGSDDGSPNQLLLLQVHYYF